MLCIQRYDNPQNFLSLFDPSKQTHYTRDLQRVYMGDAPSLGTLAKAWGEEMPESWLIMQLIDLSEFAGVREKFTTHQVDSLAKLIRNTWGYYKVTEMMLFFTQFKAGKYGKFYGSVDSMVITEALQEFDKERCRAIDKYRQEQEERQKQQDAERSRVAAAQFNAHVRACGMSIQDYIETANRHGLDDEEMGRLCWLFNLGYEPERLAEERERELATRSAAERRRAEIDRMIADLQRQRAELEH